MGSTALDDAALIERVNAGDEAAIEALYTRYGGPCFGLARRILDDAQLAEDVVQQVFLALWKGTGYDPKRGAVSTWLMSMTHHKAVDSLRRESTRRKRLAGEQALLELRALGPGTRGRGMGTTAGRADPRRPAPAALRTARGAAARLLRGLHATRDRRPHRFAAGHGEEPDACGDAAAARTAVRCRRTRRGGGVMTSHDQWDELAAGYALHALEPDEEQRFTEHLATCADCSAMLGDHELVAAQLGTLSYDDEQSEDAPSWSTIRGGVIGDAPPVSLDSHRRARARRRQPWLLGAAAAVIAAVAAVVIATQTTGGSTPASSRAISSCRHISGCNVISLHTATGDAPGVVLVSAGKATMVPLAMKPAPAGSQYVLWQMLRTGAPVPVDDFRSGTALQTAPLVMPYDDTAAFAVSVEPTSSPPSQPTNVIAIGNTTA